VARLRSAAHAYLNFAFTEPGLFNTAFCHDDPVDPGFADEDLNYSGVEAFVFLGRLLDELVAGGMGPTGLIGFLVARSSRGPRGSRAG
jgi:hypothetical protein